MNELIGLLIAVGMLVAGAVAIEDCYSCHDRYIAPGYTMVCDKEAVGEFTDAGGMICRCPHNTK